MKNYRVLVALLSGMILFSCSMEGDTESEENGIDVEERSGDSNGEIMDEESMQEMEEAEAQLIWKNYRNERFDFCVDYPSNFLTPQGESENHDGNTFANANGSSEMRVSGIYNALDETIEEAFERATENDVYYDDERKITYKTQEGDWFVASGNYNESIFYVRSSLIRDTFYTLYFEYHASEVQKFDEIIKRAKNFPDC
ncbi:MAG: hypothetical protein AB8B56_05925 [Crocinitomicaceae bacterium]